MSRFSEKLQKKLLPSAEFFIKSVESRYQEPLKQAQLINKEIATLRNPRNLRAASSRSAGAYTQLLQHYLKAQTSADTKNKDFIDKVNAKLDDLNQQRSSSTAIFQQQKKVLDEAIDETLGRNFTGERDFEKFKGQLQSLDIYDKTSGEATLASLFAMRHALSKTESEGVQKYIRIEMNDIIRTIDDEYRDATDAEMPDVDTYINEKYPDLSRKTAQGRKNRAERLSEDWLRKNYALLGFRSSDVATYRNYQPDIDRLRSIVFGNAESVVSTLPSMTPEQQEQFVKKEPGLTVEEGRVVVDRDASPEKQKGAQILLNSMPEKNPTPSAFIASPVVRGAYSGLESGERTRAKMEARAQELEQLRDQRLDAALQEGRLSPAEMSVLTNPLFTRTGFRRTPSYGLLKRRAKRLERQSTAAATPEDTAEDIKFGGFPKVDEPTAEPTAEPPSEKTGVPVLPGVVNRLEVAINEAMEPGADGLHDPAKSDKLIELAEDFQALPQSVRDRFPEQFRTMLVNYRTDGFPSPEGKVLGEEERLMAMKNYLERGVGVTTETVSDYVGDLATVEEDIGDKLVETSRLLEFLNHPDAVGTASEDAEPFLVQLGKESPLGTLGDDFQKALLDGQEDEIDAVISRASQTRRPDAGYDMETYGVYGSLQRFEDKFAKDAKKEDEIDFRQKGSDIEVEQPQEDYPLDPVQRELRDYYVDTDDEGEIDELPRVKTAEESMAELQKGAEEIKSERRALAQARDRAGGVNDDDAIRAGFASMEPKTPKTAPAAPTPEPAPAADEEFYKQSPESIEVEPPRQEDTDESELLVAAQPTPPPPPKTPEQREREAAAAASAGVGDEPGSLVIAEGANQESDETLVADSARLDSKGRELPRASMPQRQQRARAESLLLRQRLEDNLIDIDEAMRQGKALAKKYPDFIDSGMPQRIMDQYLIDNVQFKGSGVEDVRRADPPAEEPKDTQEPYSLDPKNLPVVEPNMLTNRTNNAKILRDEFTKLGYGENQIQAFVATAMAESKLDATSKNMGTAEKPEDSHGLFQFNRRRGEGKGFEVSELQNPYFQVMKIHEAISTRPELAFFKNNPDASVEDLVVDFNVNYVRPAGIRGQEKQDERKAYIPYARRELDKLEQDQIQVASP